VLSPSGKFAQSPYLQEFALYVGQELVFSDGEECLERIGNISIDRKQIERLCHHYGQRLEDMPVKPAPEKKESSAHYVMVDGSMVLCRKDSWSEMKLARVFPAEAVLECSKTRNWVRESHYTAHMGCSDDFVVKLDSLIASCGEKVFIADGAKWIWKHIEASYPGSMQILDYYHAMQYLHNFSRDHFRSKAKRAEFVSECAILLNDDRVESVIERVRQIVPSERSSENHKKLVGYYTNNSKRMMYKTFKSKGYAIGSGAMEAANRTVIQERAKRSGQRWTKEGVQQVVNLRVAHQSDQWSIVTDLVRNVA
jgi:hypothetical protein